MEYFLTLVYRLHVGVYQQVFKIVLITFFSLKKTDKGLDKTGL